jgi:N-acetylneuraminic acid mutarotase
LKNCKFLTATISLSALIAMVGAFFIPASSMAAAYQPGSVGLTHQGIKNVRQSNSRPERVAMASQSSLKLLSHATEKGPHASKSIINLTVALKLRNKAKLKSFLEQVQNSHSETYRHWLTPAEFTKLYGPSKADVARVAAFLKAHDIKVTGVSSNRMLIHTEATTAVYEHALRIHINDYKLNGRRFYSTTDKPKLPREVATRVVNILGLNHGRQMRPHSYTQPLASARDLSPRQSPPASLTNMNPLQIAHAYNYPDITDASNGQDVKVAILTALSPGLEGMSDPHNFWDAFGLPDHTINVIPVGGDSAPGGLGETLLDIEYSGAMGPGITQNVYVAADATGQTFSDMYNQFANDTNDDGTARNQVMTTSWGAPEAGSDAVDDQIFMQAAAEGISMFAAAGDAGSGDGTPSDNVADYPSSSPYITASNGTQLNISDLEGDYGSEVVWNDADCFGNGPASTGGAVSDVFDKPDWQSGPGVPSDIDMRMNSDMAATASCTKPMLVLQGGQWALTAGTSAVAPQFAGLFAIAVAENGGPVGQSSKLIYDDVNAGNQASDFHDVTEGNNGAFEARPNWDHPTGWGSPNAANLLSHIGIQGPKGTLEGTVTDAASGEPVGGAKLVMAVGAGTTYTATSASDGTYSRILPAGETLVTINDFGYKEASDSVSIGDGDSTTADFALEAASQATLSGKVTDGSGHGYGLYAEVRVKTEDFGQVADVWTDPSTGQYSLKLPDGGHYTITAAAALDGYKTASKDVTLDGNSTENISLAVTAACTAPGYKPVTGGISEDFNEDDFPPHGWTVTNPADGNVEWSVSGSENYTGGTGDAAAADNIASNQSGEPYDTSLVTPPIPVTSLQGSTVLRYKANYIHALDDALDLEISTDGGDSWSTISHWTDDHGTNSATPGYDAKVDLADYLPASGSFQLRWRYYDLAGGWDWYAQIDEISTGGCAPVQGGLVTGRVTSAANGKGLVGAKVSDDEGDVVKTMSNPADPDFADGTYVLFALSGDRGLTVSASGYTSETGGVTVENDKIVPGNDFALKAPRFEAEPDHFNVHVQVGEPATASFALSNTGEGRGVFEVHGINTRPPATGAAAVPVKLATNAHPDWVNKSRFWIRKHVKPSEWRAPPARVNAVAPHEAAWENLADYPIAIGDNLAAYDPRTERVYVVTGTDESNPGEPASYAYDSEADTWESMADIPTPREAPQGGFINGKLYVVGGVGASGAVGETDVYNPATDSWSTDAASDPAPAFGAGYAVLDNKLYVIGGVDPTTNAPSSTVEVYDPDGDSWSAASDYPQVIAFPACGGIDGKLYCAAGGGNTSNHTEGYVYDPDSDAWSPIADVNVSGGILGAAYSTANGKLILAGGFVGDSLAATNQVEAYDPESDSWQALPNTNKPVARAGGTCGADGFYTVGSIDLTAGFSFTDTAQRLPGYMCSGGGIPWLTTAPASGTLPAGATIRVTLAFDGTDQKEDTESNAYLKVTGGPSSMIVPITVHWDPKPVDLDVSGNVSPIGTVDAGDNLTYNITVQNLADAEGSASETTLTYEVPEGVSYLASNGSVCAPPGGSVPPPETAGIGRVAPAMMQGPATLTCDLGTIDPNQGKLVTIAVQAATSTDSVSATFKASAREPQEGSGNTTLTLDTNPNAGPPGPTGPTGPEGPKGDKGSGGLGLLGLGVLALFAAGTLALETRRRKGTQK